MDFIVSHFWALLLVAIIIGIFCDFMFSITLGQEGLVLSVALPIMVIAAMLTSNGMVSAKHREAERVAQNEQLKNCVKFAERDAQSIWQYPQVGYRCPAMDGQPSIERWINKD